jgi:GDPmannose 4,6-dehydratase
MWLMLQQPEPDDYVVATGVTHSIRDVLRVAFERAGIDDWESRVEQDPSLVRAEEPYPLVGDASKARERLGWTPRVSFEELIAMMVDADLAATAPR